MTFISHNTATAQVRTLLVAILALLMVACKSSKHANDISTTPVVEHQVTTIGQQPDVPANPPVADNPSGYNPATGENFTSKVLVSIKMGDKQITTSGSLRMRRGQVIQVSLLDPIVGWTEVGRLELTPQSIIIIDRLNKRYVESTYSEANALASQSLAFPYIERMVWNEAQDKDKLHYTIPTGKNAVELDIEISARGNADNWEYGAPLSSKYQKIDVGTLFRSLMNQM